MVPTRRCDDFCARRPRLCWRGRLLLLHLHIHLLGLRLDLHQIGLVVAQRGHRLELATPLDKTCSCRRTGRARSPVVAYAYRYAFFFSTARQCAMSTQTVIEFYARYLPRVTETSVQNGLGPARRDHRTALRGTGVAFWPLRRDTGSAMWRSGRSARQSHSQHSDRHTGLRAGLLRPSLVQSLVRTLFEVTASGLR